MIKINLIPPEALEKEKKKKIIILGILCGTAFVSFAVVILLFRFTTLRILTGRQASLEQEKVKYQTIVDEVNRLKSLSGTLEVKKNIIGNLMKGRVRYPKFMEYFMSLLPQEIWIRSLNTTTTSDGFTFSVDCVSFSYFAIADFVASLESSQKFTNIDLGAISTAEAGEKGSETYNFAINCVYHAG